MELTLPNTMALSAITAMAFLAYNKPKQAIILGLVVASILVFSLVCAEAYEIGFTSGESKAVSQMIDANPSGIKHIPKIDSGANDMEGNLFIYLIATGVIVMYAIYNEPTDNQSPSETAE